MNYWYVARANEIFIDTDNFARSMQHTKMRLQGAIECGKLDVAYIMQRPSKSNGKKGKGHVHTIITLRQEMDAVQRAVWALILHSDIYRAACTIMRCCHAVVAPDVLISPFSYFSENNNDFVAGVRRIYDDRCDCDMKHNAYGMAQCPAAQRLRGEKRLLTFFGKPSRNKCEIWP